jgi:hypothetical protein
VADGMSWTRVGLRLRWAMLIQRLPLPLRRVLRRVRQMLRGPGDGC